MAPTVLFCERCSIMRSDVATGSLIGAAAGAGVLATGVEDCAKASAAETTRQPTARVGFTEKPPGTPSIYRRRVLGHLNQQEPQPQGTLRTQRSSRSLRVLRVLLCPLWLKGFHGTMANALIPPRFSLRHRLEGRPHRSSHRARAVHGLPSHRHGEPTQALRRSWSRCRASHDVSRRNR